MLNHLGAAILQAIPLKRFAPEQINDVVDLHETIEVATVVTFTCTLCAVSWDVSWVPGREDYPAETIQEAMNRAHEHAAGHLN